MPFACLLMAEIELTFRQKSCTMVSVVEGSDAMNTEEMLVTILHKINSVDTKMDSMEKRMDSMEKRMDSLEARIKPLEALPQQMMELQQQVEKVQQQVDGVQKQVDGVQQQVDGVQQQVEKVQKQVDGVQQQVTEMQLTLENEIRRNISFIAEGHLDLDRKLDKAMEFQKEKEIFLLRTTALEGDVQRIKSRIGME